MSENLLDLDLNYGWIWFCAKGIDNTGFSSGLEKFKAKFGLTPDVIIVKSNSEDIKNFCSDIPILESNYILPKTVLFGVLNHD